MLSKIVKMIWRPSNKNFYINKGYIYKKMNDEFVVKVNDLSENSHIMIKVLCDYCQISIIEKEYRNYLKSRKIIDKDCCNECRHKKIEDVFINKYGVKSSLEVPQFKEKIKKTNLEKYGVEHYAKTEEIKEKRNNTVYKKYGVDNVSKNDKIKEKIKQTNIKKYGVESYTQTKEYKEKIKQTNLKKYGVEHHFLNDEIQKKRKQTFIENYGVENPFQAEEIKEKIKKYNIDNFGVENNIQRPGVREKIFNAMYKNGTQKCSLQQKYLFNLFNGELNYPVGGYSLDIAFLEEKVYIEFDGSGHDLPVKIGNVSNKDFKQKEIKRNYFLKNRGWNKIEIVSRKDRLPNDMVLLQMIKFAKEYLNIGHSWIKFDIDNNKIINSTGEFFYDFGKLRKIKKESIQGGVEIETIYASN